MYLKLLDLGIDMRRDSREVYSQMPFKPRSDRARPRASTRPTCKYRLMYAYSSSCQLCHFQLRHCIVNDVISTGVVW